MSESILSNFSCLDELIQIIYQSIYSFTVLSNVSDDDDKWTVHIGLTGPEGRWWQGIWTSEDVMKIVGAKPSEFLLEKFAENLAENFSQGQLCITDWDRKPGANIKLTFGPTSKKPLHIPLKELSKEEGAEFTSKIFTEIALQAQSRKCRLFGQSAQTTDTTSSLPAVTVSSELTSNEPPLSDVTANAAAKPNKPLKKSGSSKSNGDLAAPKQDNPMTRKRHASPSFNAETSKARSPQPKVPKLAGSSLANPNKKARRFQAVEFGSDSDD